MRRTKINVSGFLGYGRPHVGEIHLPMSGGGCIQVKQLGWSPWSAIKKAILVANDVARNPAVAQFLPPQVNMAITAANTIAQLSKAGLEKLRDHPMATPAQKALAVKLLESPEMQGSTPTTAGFMRGKPRITRGRKRTLHGGKPGTQGQKGVKETPPPPPPDDGGGDDGGDEDPGDDSVEGYYYEDDEEDIAEMQMSNSAMATEAWGPDSNEEQAKKAWGKHAFAPGSFD